MGKKRNVISYHVEIEQESPGRYPGRDPHYALEDEKRICKGIVDQIKRHVDGVASVMVVEEAEVICEHCGGLWTEGNDPDNAGCCDADVDEMDKRKERTDDGQAGTG